MSLVINFSQLQRTHAHKGGLASMEGCDRNGDEDEYVGGDEDGGNDQQQVVTEDVNIPCPASNALVTNL